MRNRSSAALSAFAFITAQIPCFLLTNPRFLCYAESIKKHRSFDMKKNERFKEKKHEEF